jgi:hypothetical protein
MAAGAILPPLFFAQRRFGSILASVHGALKNGLGSRTPWKIQPASITQFERPARSSPTTER